MQEEIIIDGVNVAGCKDYDDGTCCNDDVLTLSCEKANCMYKQLKRLEQENKELKKQHYETLKMLKHEYDGRQRDNEQWFTRCTENHNEDSKIIEKYRSALEEIRGYFLNPNSNLELQTRQVMLNKINEVLK